MTLKTKEVYQTLDGLFVRTTTADESPLEAGRDPVVWLVPGGAVEIAPPTIPEGKQARWSNNEWSLEDIPEPEEPIAGEQ